MTAEDLQALLNRADIALALALFIVGLVRGWWIMGDRFRDMRQDRDEWRELALGGQVIARRSLTLATHNEAHETAGTAEG